MHHRRLIFVILIACTCAAATRPSTQPATRPAGSTGDPALDFLLESASDLARTPTTLPSKPPSTRPANPFTDGRKNAGVRPGVIHLSNGQKIRGKIATTQGKPLRVWVEKDKDYHDVAFESIASVDATLLWERDEKEWRFRESGSDVKIYSGKTYPLRELQYTLTLTDGNRVEGGVVAPLDVQTKDGRFTFVLNKRQKGEVGQSLKDLVYPVRVELE
ncbi:hypothetical protein [Humisphaera borealis]|uniref:Intracellular proteinase inhibitor BsuPI domain-containing protein n=1 Tax=Humisphaera borealis TaxID=2807512 RepID=A0A7M2X2L8_9BACT|nr:hypothetical protein [Humisphaera borealis]QOV91859.1 hypothetical protein IPV69_11095 [Humisphaera borealis]